MQPIEPRKTRPNWLHALDRCVSCIICKYSDRRNRWIIWESCSQPLSAKKTGSTDWSHWDRPTLKHAHPLDMSHKEQCQDKIAETKCVSSLLRKAGNVGDDVTSSGRPFHVRAAATLNCLLPIADSLNGGTTRRSMLAERRRRRPGKSNTRTSGPK